MIRKFNLVFMIIVLALAALCNTNILKANENNPKLVLNNLDTNVEKFKNALGTYWSADYENAEILFQEIIDSEPEFAKAQIFLADCQYAQNKNDLASESYLKAYELLNNKNELRKKLLPDVKQPELYSDIVYCLNALERYDEAKAQGMIGTLHGQIPDLYINMAYAFFKLGNVTAATANYCKSTKITTPNEIQNFNYLRIKNIFEKGNDWVIECIEDEKYKAPGTNYALIIALGNYQDSKISSLRYAENDARQIYKVITDKRSGLFKSENVTVLINEKATEKKIKFAFDDITQKAIGEDDLLFVFYAGHGFTYPNSSDTYWFTYDTVVGDENANRIKSTAFSNLNLATKIADMKAKNVVFFVDACFSSGIVSKPKAIRGLETYLGTGKNYIIITSSQANQQSAESSHLKHGLFSYALIKGLAGNADNNTDGLVDIEELWPFISSTVLEQANLMGIEQTPRRSGSSGGAVILSKNPYN